MAVASETADAARAEARLTPRGMAARAAVAVLIAILVFLIPQISDDSHDQWIGLMAIYAVIGLSVNVITGHAGQISLGHQAFVGIGAFTSAYLVVDQGVTFFLALPIAGFTGGIMALVLGLVALRIRGLYLALITLSFGLMAETTVFSIRGFTGGGAGKEAPRPTTFQTNEAYAYLCFLVLAFFLFVDWRLVKSKAGRAIVSVRNDERVAASLGINVVAYKLTAFVLGGFIAGVAGGLFAHWNQFVNTEDFNFFTALVWILMSVVGGLGSRAGVVIGSAFFAVFPLFIGEVAGGSSFRIPFIGDVLIQILSPFIGALLLLLTITRYPGGIGQQLTPLRRWLAGGQFLVRHHRAQAMASGGTLVAAEKAVAADPAALQEEEELAHVVEEQLAARLQAARHEDPVPDGSAAKPRRRAPARRRPSTRRKS